LDQDYNVTDEVIEADLERGLQLLNPITGIGVNDSVSIGIQVRKICHHEVATAHTRISRSWWKSGFWGNRVHLPDRQMRENF
jgi:hypothetical protein